MEMADNLPSVDLPSGEWVDLYAETGISPGVAIEVENTGTCDVHVTVRETQPPTDWKEFNILQRLNGVRLRNSEGDSGAWAFCANTNGKVTVRAIDLSTEGFHPSFSTDIPKGIGRGIPLDAWGRPKSVIDASLFHGMFTFNIPADKWYEMIDDVEQTGFVSATSVDGKLVLTSGALNEKRQLRSFRHPRYEPNRGHLYSTSAFLPNVTAAGQRSFGLFTSENGVFFRLRSGSLFAVLRTTVSDVTTDNELPIDIPSDVDIEKGNIFDIQFQWRGVGSYFFYINQRLVLSHNILGSLSELSISNPSLPVAFESINQGDVVSIQNGCVDVTSEGGVNNGKSYGSVSTESDTGSVSISGLNIPIVVVRNKKIFDGKLNTRDVLALLATAYSDQRCVFRVWATRDETAITLNDQVWIDFRDAHIEYLVYDTPNVATPMTFDASKAELIFGARVDQDQSYATSALFEGRTEIYHTPGDIFIFTMHRETGANASVGVTYEFAEAI